MATARTKRLVTVIGVVGTVCGLVGSITGAGWTLANDRQAVIQQNTINSERVNNLEKSINDKMKDLDSRLSIQDQRWAALEQRLDPLAQDVAVIKAISERMERQLNSYSPPVQPLDRKTK